jgi:hypothetical protein
MQNYTVKTIDAWGRGDMFSVTFVEASGEPVDFKCPGAVPKPGEVIMGKIEQYEARSGMTRNRFVTETAQKEEDHRQMEINTSWAISNALQIVTDYEKDQIKAAAEMLLEIKKELLNG